MPETAAINFSFLETVEALIRQADLHEGIWGLRITFGLKAANIGDGPEPGEDMMPAAIVPITNIGLQKQENESPMALDAKKVNPARKTHKRGKG